MNVTIDNKVYELDLEKAHAQGLVKRVLVIPEKFLTQFRLDLRDFDYTVIHMNVLKARYDAAVKDFDVYTNILIKESGPVTDMPTHKLSYLSSLNLKRIETLFNFVTYKHQSLEWIYLKIRTTFGQEATANWESIPGSASLRLVITPEHCTPIPFATKLIPNVKGEVPL